MNRPIVTVTLGVIIGIIWGLYFDISTISFVILIIVLLYLAKQLSVKAKRYLKVLFRKGFLILLICSIILSFIYTKFREYLYQTIQEKDEVELVGEIQSSYTQNKYSYSYKIRIETKLYMLYVKTKKTAKEFEYGDIIKLTGKIELPEESRNYCGFSQKDYYRSKGIYGIIYANNAEKVGHRFSIWQIADNIRNNIENKIKKGISNSNAGILLGILIGDKTGIDGEEIEEFRKSSLIHILCVSRSTHWIYTTLA